MKPDGANVGITINAPGNYAFELECCSVDRIQSLLSSPDRIGFGRNTTGGKNASSYTVVSNTNDSGSGSLRDALSKAGPTWIIFSPNIYGKTIVVSKNINITNKDITLDGRGSQVTIKMASGTNFPLFTFRGGNTIITGITLNGNSTIGTALMLREGENYWIDHITVTNFSSEDGLSIGQGNRPDTSASEVTVSNYLVHNTAKGLRGGGNDKYPDFKRNRVTVFNSNLSAKDRNPRAQYGSQFHVFNNYIHSFTYSGMDSGRTAQVISQNNVFLTNKAKSDTNAQMARPDGSDSPTGYIYSSGDVFLDGALSIGAVNPSSPKAYTIPYDYELMPADSVIEYVLANAGAANTDDSFDSCTVYNKSFVVSSN